MKQTVFQKAPILIQLGEIPITYKTKQFRPFWATTQSTFALQADLVQQSLSLELDNLLYLSCGMELHHCILPVQGTVLYGLGKMDFADILFFGQIGNGARNF